MFVGQSGDKRASPDFSADEQLACRWKKVRLKNKSAEKNQNCDAVAAKLTWSFCSPPSSAIYSSTACKTWWIMSTTSTSSPKRIPGTAATGRAAPGRGGASMPGETTARLVFDKKDPALPHWTRSNHNVCLQVQDAHPHSHPHQREAAPLPHLQQELLPPREPQDTQPVTHRSVCVSVLLLTEDQKNWLC